MVRAETESSFTYSRAEIVKFGAKMSHWALIFSLTP
jgi:hypothetical protein